jgi:hypothetical protein
MDDDAQVDDGCIGGVLHHVINHKVLQGFSFFVFESTSPPPHKICLSIEGHIT